jgi:cytidylate kinase
MVDKKIFRDGKANNSILIGVVGVCASGKSTLIKSLEENGYRARHIAQEHSYVKDMWKRITNPDILIFLDVTYEKSLERRMTDWREKDYAEQQRRLAHAREYSNLYIDTTDLSEGQVMEKVVEYIRKYRE